ncbi:Protein DJ-1 protein [Aphelenchoides bicaudatus]|nr:Protein DJ-1 protein [Aphelenchoides bicaudatus]
MRYVRPLLVFRTLRLASEHPRTMSKTALVLATDGSEEIELLATVDILRRANVNVTVAGLTGNDILELSRKVKVQVDKHLKDVANETFDAVVLPGGPGHKHYGTNEDVGKVLKHHESSGKILAAICAGPLGFKAHNIASGAAVACYPSVEEEMKSAGYNVSQDNVVVSSNVDTGSGSASIVTSRGPGTTFEFALKIVALLAGDEVESNVRKAILL